MDGWVQSTFGVVVFIVGGIVGGGVALFLTAWCTSEPEHDTRGRLTQAGGFFMHAYCFTYSREMNPQEQLLSLLFFLYFFEILELST